MKNTLPSNIHPLGIGTYGLGTTREEFAGSALDETSLAQDKEATLYRIGLGHNYFETNYSYANGESLRFLSTVFSEVPRNKVYLFSKLTDPIYSEKDVKIQLDRYLSLMKVSFVDEVGFTKNAAGELPHELIYHWLSRQIKMRKARFLHGANYSLSQLKNLEERGISFASLEGLFNLECKNNETNGVINYCMQNNIVFVAYQPLRRGRTAARNYPFLVSLAQKYHTTQNQILLNWIVNHKGLHVLNKSSNLTHINENEDALSLKVTDEDYALLNQWRSAEFDAISVNWENKGGIPINKLANQLP